MQKSAHSTLQPRTRVRLGLACFALLGGASLFSGGQASEASDSHVLADEDRFLTNRESGVTLPLPKDEDAFTFAVYGDRTGGPAEGIHVLAQAVEDTNLFAPDLVMTVGDLIQGYNQTPAWMAQMLQFKGVMGALDMPWFPVAGNHDIYWRGNGRPEGEHETNYEQHFGPLWYAFEHQNCWFVVLFSDEGDPKTGERTFHRPESQSMSPEQFAWLQDTLKRTQGAEHVFVFLHHPRWIGGGYGSDWDRVHHELAAAGNVSAVFAGHIHLMRYDGVRDGIEYFTLATVGGHQSGDVPEAGFLHEFHMVTVRGDDLAISVVPVGAVLDPREITAEVSDDVRTLSRDVRPRAQVDLLFDPTEGAAFEVPMELTNPTSRTIEVSSWLQSADWRWRSGSEHVHMTIEPGATAIWTFHLDRPAHTLDDDFAMPELHWQIDYLAEHQRISSPERTAVLELVLTAYPETGVALDTPVRRQGMRFDGSDSLSIASERLRLHDGPFTVETWMKADKFHERQGLINKTESSGYGFFISGGVPAFMVHSGRGYDVVEADGPILKQDTWHHLAGVFTGAEVLLYVDGQLIGRRASRGARRANDLPLIVGADVDGSGNPTGHFVGVLDELRISNIARYTGDSFEPGDTYAIDEHTVLQLPLDGQRGPWVRDVSPTGTHPTVNGDPTLYEYDR